MKFDQIIKEYTGKEIVVEEGARPPGFDIAGRYRLIHPQASINKIHTAAQGLRTSTYKGKYDAFATNLDTLTTNAASNGGILDFKAATMMTRTPREDAKKLHDYIFNGTDPLDPNLKTSGPVLDNTEIDYTKTVPGAPKPAPTPGTRPPGKPGARPPAGPKGPGLGTKVVAKVDNAQQEILSALHGSQPTIQSH